MYALTTRSKKAEKQFYKLLETRSSIRKKLQQLQEHPRSAIGAHKLKGKLAGKWSADLGADIRLVYEVDDANKEIIVAAAGSHKIYK
ncbi:MAG: type II toxin-antitoxin system mRNA interferase toxin, RelE/StbE family [Candidatus Woesearchaeota archaeon]|nr:type II toxin-antitoxin system mRNA interferase toxin, RelE/StbE family [Candidatus Woesearchaeota archaeon]